eukprot:PITA_19160
MSLAGWVVLLISLISYLVAITNAAIVNYTFIIEAKTVTRLCKENTIITVNGQLPGPTIYVHDGDTVIVETYNKAEYNATLHWHGVEQLRTPWADGPAYVTQCPISPGEWWNANPIAVIDEAVRTGGATNLSDAFTINGQPGDLFNCSTSGTFRLPVKSGETYLLRIVNAALNSGHFLKIAGHEFTVVAVDACYTKPYKTEVLVISAGQTTDVLLTANQSAGRYSMAVRAYQNQAAGDFDNTTTTAIVEYIGAENSTSPLMPSLPAYNDTHTVNIFSSALRSLASQEHPVDVPQTIDENLMSTVGLGLLPCETGNTCEGPNGTRLSASMNNISYVEPTISLLQAYYYNKSTDGYTTGFPSKPEVRFNYTGDDIPRKFWTPDPATKVKVLEYNSTVQLVFQATNIFVAENHPMHLHGYNFYVVGQGSGNYDPVKDQLKFNLVDPPQRNTVIAPVSGWVAIRFKPDNPGMWFLHCHLDDHFTWGLNMVFLVRNGGTP